MPPKPFKPPRPSGQSSTSKSGPGRPRKSDTSAPNKRKSTPSITKSAPTPKRLPSAREMGLPSLSPETDAAPSPYRSQDSLDDDPFASQPVPTSKQKSKRRRDEVEEDEEGEEEGRETIPGDLISVLLHEFFSDGTRMTKGANGAVGKYLDVFVREGVARCVFRGGEGDEGGGVVEVEDLEKEAPQLLLDF